MKEQNPKMHLTSLDSLFTTQAERDNADNEQVIKISIDSIHDFPNHPFKVNDDEDMNKLLNNAHNIDIWIFFNEMFDVNSLDLKMSDYKIDKTKDYLIIKKQSFRYELKDDN